MIVRLLNPSGVPAAQVDVAGATLIDSLERRLLQVTVDGRRWVIPGLDAEWTGDTVRALQDLELLEVAAVRGEMVLALRLSEHGRALSTPRAVGL